VSLFSFKKKSAQELVAAGNYKGAAKLFKQSLASKGFDPGVAMQLANCHLKLDESKDAKALFLRVGTHYGDQGFFNKAVAAFKKALNISPEDQGILDKLAEYHGKVPQYMVDDRILQRASGFFQAPNQGEIEAASAGIDDDDHWEPPEEIVSSMSTNPVEIEKEPPDEASEPSPEIPVSPSEAPAAEVEGAPADSSLDFSDFHGLDELQDEVATEISFDDAPGSGKGDGTLDRTDMFAELLDGTQPGDSGAAEQAPAEDATASKAPPEKTSAENAPPPAAPETAAMDNAPGRAVFSSRKEDEEGSAAPSSGFFESLDDALDTLFEAGTDPSERTLEQIEEKKAQDQRHWPLFRTMPSNVFLEFVMALDAVDFEAGDYIVREGDSGTEMYLIAHGSVDVVIGDKAVAQLEEGNFFGEASLLTRSPRNATCRARELTNCLVLTREHLEALAASHPGVMDAIRSIYYTRVEQNAARNRQGEA